MTLLNKGQTNRLLGYPVDARLLIINADDFGMCHAVNEAVIRALKEGVLRSTTLMAPCPWALHAMHFLADHPEIPFGVHLTVISEWADYRWGPLTPREKAPSLIDLAIEGDSKHVRQTDFEFLMSQAAKDIVKEEGIILLDYRALQAVWRGK